ARVWQTGVRPSDTVEVGRDRPLTSAAVDPTGSPIAVTDEAGRLRIYLTEQVPVPAKGARRFAVAAADFRLADMLEKADAKSRPRPWCWPRPTPATWRFSPTAGWQSRSATG